MNRASAAKRVMLKRTAGALAVSIAVLAAPATFGAGAAAESLWAKAEAQGNRLGLFADARARKAGDLVTIIIVERAEATSSASTGTKHDGKVEVGPGQGLLDVLPLVGGSGSSRFTGDGRTARSGTIRAQMTARVTQVLSNGDLVVEGRQTIVVNEEEQELVLTGIIRPADISRDNTILSTYVSDARITVRGKGSLGGHQKPGILTRMFGWLF